MKKQSPLNTPRHSGQEHVTDMAQKNGKFAVQTTGDVQIQRRTSIATKVFLNLCIAFSPVFVLSIPDKSDPDSKNVTRIMWALYLFAGFVLHVLIAGNPESPDGAASSSFISLAIRLVIGQVAGQLVLVFLTNLFSRQLALAYMAVSIASDGLRIVCELVLREPDAAGYLTLRWPFALWEVLITLACFLILRALPDSDAKCKS